MANFIIKTVVRTLLSKTSREKAEQRTREILEGYLKLAEGMSVEEAGKSVRVPPMRGVDEDMREWSFFMILEHNAIVNDIISAAVQRLARGEPPESGPKVDPKRDVMPSHELGEEQIERFRLSVENHLASVTKLGALRGTSTSQHPIFGAFDAQRWNNMFWFHLKLHYDQAVYVCREAAEDRSRAE